MLVVPSNARAAEVARSALRRVSAPSDRSVGPATRGEDLRRRVHARRSALPKLKHVPPAESSPADDRQEIERERNVANREHQLVLAVTVQVVVEELAQVVRAEMRTSTRRSPTRMRSRATPAR